jgi:putative peptidoglycan lipid II flippase
MTVGQAFALRRDLRGLELRETLAAVFAVLMASGVLACVTWIAWALLDEALGRSLPAQVMSVGAALAAGGAVYAFLVGWMQVPEAEQIRRLLAGRLRRG